MCRNQLYAGKKVGAKNDAWKDYYVDTTDTKGHAFVTSPSKSKRKFPAINLMFSNFQLFLQRHRHKFFPFFRPATQFMLDVSDAVN